MSLRGIEMMAKISGEGAKHLAVYLFAALQGQKKTKGRIRLESLLRSGKELKVFAVKNEDLPTFCKEAKRYGVLYCALRDKKNVDGLCDVMVRAEDASKINRIVERFKLATVDTASIKQEIANARSEKQLEENQAAQTPKQIGETHESEAMSPPFHGGSQGRFFGRIAGKDRTAGGSSTSKRATGSRTLGTGYSGSRADSQRTGATSDAADLSPDAGGENEGTGYSVRAYLRAQRRQRKGYD